MQTSLLDSAYIKNCIIELNNFIHVGKKLPKNKAVQNIKKKEENKVSGWQKETPLDVEINFMGRTINWFNIKMEQEKAFL